MESALSKPVFGVEVALPSPVAMPLMPLLYFLVRLS
jgi:hypothetical protein